MIPVLILTLLWVWALVTEFTHRPLCRRPFAYLIFPLGFVILACLRIALGMNEFFGTMKIQGPMDPIEFAEDGLVLSRALLWIAGLASASWFSAVVVMLCRGDKRRVV